MRIFLHEFVTGGGWYTQASHVPAASLAAEGYAMLSALAADFTSLSGVSVDVLRDARFRHLDLPRCTIHEVESAAQEWQAIRTLSASSDWALIIAPEFDGHLYARSLAVEQAGGRLLSPSAPFVALAADKQATAERLADFGLRVPRGMPLEAGQALPADFTYPAVLKPRAGAGSQGVRLIAKSEERPARADWPARLESYCQGLPASVALLCGGPHAVPLAPCRQRLDVEQGFAYLGGSLPLEPPLARRAARLAVQATDALGSTRGYVGVDLVLGDDDSGARDVVIEVNPRMTTSYVGLRAVFRGNLAECMLAVAEGRQVELCWQAGPIQFEAAGVVRRIGGAR